MTTTKKAPLIEDEFIRYAEKEEFSDLKKVAGMLWGIRDYLVCDGDSDSVVFSLANIADCSEKIASEAVDAWTEEAL